MTMQTTLPSRERAEIWAPVFGGSTTSAFIDSFWPAMGRTPGAYRDLAARWAHQGDGSNGRSAARMRIGTLLMRGCPE
jgi:hypothetical protein